MKMINNLEKKAWKTPLWYASLFTLNGCYDQPKQQHNRLAKNSTALLTESVNKGSKKEIKETNIDPKKNKGDEQVAVVSNNIPNPPMTYVDHAITPIQNSIHNNLLDTTQPINPMTAEAHNDTVSVSNVSCIKPMPQEGVVGMCYRHTKNIWPYIWPFGGSVSSNNPETSYKTAVVQKEAQLFYADDTTQNPYYTDDEDS